MTSNCGRIVSSVQLSSIVISNVVMDAKDSSDKADMSFVHMRDLIPGICHGESLSSRYKPLDEKTSKA